MQFFDAATFSGTSKLLKRLMLVFLLFRAHVYVTDEQRNSDYRTGKAGLVPKPVRHATALLQH